MNGGKRAGENRVGGREGWRGRRGLRGRTAGRVSRGSGGAPGFEPQLRVVMPTGQSTYINA